MKNNKKGLILIVVFAGFLSQYQVSESSEVQKRKNEKMFGRMEENGNGKKEIRHNMDFNKYLSFIKDVDPVKVVETMIDGTDFNTLMVLQSFLTYNKAQY